MSELRPVRTRRSLLGFMAIMPALFACRTMNAGPSGISGQNDTQVDRFEGTGGVSVLWIDALTRVRGVTVWNEDGTIIAALASVGPAAGSISAYPGGERSVPQAIRATWREGEFEQSNVGRTWVGGTIVGDYTVPVADRIPDDVLDYIRSEKQEPYWIGKSAVDGSDVYATPIGRALRLKIRLTDGGVLIGWDVEERIRTKYTTAITHKMPGGDFKEARIFNGQVVEPGWYIDRHGRRIETDH